MSEKEEPHQFSRIAEDLVGDFRGIANREPRRARKRPTQPVATVLELLLQKYQIGRSSPEQAIRDHWHEIVGSANAAYSHAVAIERNRLLVLTSHSVVRNELFMNRDAIVERIKLLPGCADIKSLYLRSG